MSATPRVSILMAVYNAARYLREAMDSVVSQDFRDFEFIIVDDCSTDETPAIIASYADPRIVYIRNERNLGQTPSLNRALREARAPYVARIDGDDAYQPGKLSRQVAYLDAHPDVAVCGTAAVKFDEEGREFGLFTPPVRPDDVAFSIHYRVPVCHVSVMMRREAVAACGGYDESYRYAADYALWSALARRGQRITNIPEPLMKYREFQQSIGAVHKVGRAGDEAAAIIAGNAKDLAGVTLSTEAARDIALLFFPSAQLSAAAICGAYRNLRTLAARTYGAVPARVRVQLAVTLFWGLVKRAAFVGQTGDAASARREIRQSLRHVEWQPAMAVAAVSAYVMSYAGEERLVRWKEAMLPLLLGRLRSSKR